MIRAAMVSKLHLGCMTRPAESKAASRTVPPCSIWLSEFEFDFDFELEAPEVALAAEELKGVS